MISNEIYTVIALRVTAEQSLLSDDVELYMSGGNLSVVNLLSRSRPDEGYEKRFAITRQNFLAAGKEQKVKD
jgi:hypothetical protein